jgi:hypothetical protein
LSSKRDEFVAWLNDVSFIRKIKKLCIDNISHIEEKKHFEEYVEDYNTCSFSSKKYYNLFKWYSKKQKSQMQP